MQPMINRLTLRAHWSVRQKLNRVSSVQSRRFVRALKHDIVLVREIASNTVHHIAIFHRSCDKLYVHPLTCPVGIM